MSRRFWISILFIINLSCAFGQEKKVLNTQRIAESVSIDGTLSESVWQKAEIATDFIQYGPSAGDPATQKTDVKVLYDDNAIYIGAVIHFTSRDSVYDNLAERDNAEETDWFVVSFDPYESGLNGFAFQVSASGVQTDLLQVGEQEDYEWNAVWLSEVQINADTWVVEMRIPFSAIRFPKKDIQQWGINFGRLIYGKREISFWNETDPNGPALINYLGTLKGISNIESPLRLSISPYISGYAESGLSPNTNEKETTYRLAGGADLRYGINDAFTLDITLVPDFGQVQFDNQIYNLSPFEVEFNENRQFFKEGRDLFDKGQIFYSRRIGAEPAFSDRAYDNLQDGESVVSVPAISQLINASKLSGRTRKGLGVGVFNGLTRSMYAEIEDSLGNKRTELVDPLTNYNVLAFDQNLKNNSSISLVNTNVLREGSFYDANVTAFVFDLFTKGQKYNYFGNANVSQLIDESENVKGHQYTLGFEKSQGKFQYGIFYLEKSDQYNINDLGFQTNNNERSVSGEIGFRTYEPKGKFVSYWYNAEAGYSRLYKPSAYTSFYVGANTGATWKNFLTTAIWGYAQPYGQDDYFEPRVTGRFYHRPAGVAANGIFSSNFNKPFALESYATFEKRDRDGWLEYSMRLTPRFRVGDRWMIIYDCIFGENLNEEGVALASTLPLDGDNPIFGRRDIKTVENKLSLRHFFTNKMTATFTGRHFWTNVEYTEFLGLNTDGSLYDIAYSGLDGNGESLHNTNFNAFTIDMVFSWVFAPGSIMSVVWKNSIFDVNNTVDLNYFQNTGDLFTLNATNSISLKILYYLDYWMIKEKLK